ncbi:MAG: ZIP family metal transporter [Succinivibrio sp.]|nr:ZIP family metal transporter [Succinivibrio sp.]
MDAFYLASAGTGFTFLCTALGAAFVYVLGSSKKKIFTQLSLGFSGGIMIAASVFGLLLPSIDEAKNAGNGLWPACGGFALGVAFLIALDRLLPHIHMMAKSPEGVHTSWGRQTLLFLAITIHNIPEGMAVGVVAAASGSGAEGAGALAALALGIGIQNVPEGAAVSVPYFAEGRSKNASFMLGALSGIVEPLGALLVVIFQGWVVSMLPWFLSFAAGAMLYVVVEELIPQSHEMGNGENDLATISVLAGFLLMMALDVGLS